MGNMLKPSIPPAPDQPAFQQLIEPFHHELLVHCYRMLGSLEDAEDALQETFLRAWRRLDSLKVQSSLRAWLYKIATHVSLDMLDGRKVRSMPTAAYAPADPHDPLPAPILDPVWLGPLPDVYLDGYIVNPESRYETLESVTLAFLAAIQRLPGRQRAILILRDVLGWKAAEIAELLDLTVAAVNSALQRARATMKKYQSEKITRSDNEWTAQLLARYVQAWEAADSASLIVLLREDAALTMPPLTVWYRGHQAIKVFLDTVLFDGTPSGYFRLTATRANGSPAFAVYHRDDSGTYRPAALHILTLADNLIAQIDDFLALDNRLFSHFGLPLAG